MAILSSDKLVVVKAFAMGNPLPLDAREIWDSLAEAKAYAASNATAYAGQTIKVVDDGVVTVYNLVPSEVEGENYALAIVGSSGSGVQSIDASNVEGNVAVIALDGDSTTSKNIPVVGALVNPVVDEDAHTLTLTKIGATANTEVVIPLGGASPEAGIVSGVEVAEDGVSLKITTFDPETETESTTEIKLAGVEGAVTDVDASVAGVLAVTTTGEDGADVVAKEAIVGAAINPTYDAATKVLTIPVVTGVAEDGTATTAAVTVDMKAVVATAFVDVAHTADTEDASAKYEFKYKDAAGAEQTKTVYETGVRKVEAGSTADKIKVTTASTTGVLSAAELLIGAGSVKNPEYDAETRKITLPILQADGTTQDLEINLGKDMVVKSGSYNRETNEIVLVLTDDSEVKIPAAALVDVYTGGTTNTVTVSTSEDNVITATVKLSTVEGNLVKSDENGLYVVEADFVATKQLIVDAQAAAEQHADDAVAGEVTARNEAIAAAKTEVNGYTDQQIAAEVTARDEAIAAAKTEVNGYTDQQVGAAKTEVNGYTDQKVAAEVTARDQAIAAAKTEVNGYTDQKVADEVTARDQAIANSAATTLAGAKGYTDEKIAAEVTARDQAIANAKTEVNGYTDQKIAAEVTARDEAIEAAKEVVNKYTDDAVAAEVTSRDTAIATAIAAAKTEVNGYTDQKVAAEVTARNEAIDGAKAEVKAYADGLVSANATTWVDFGA